jgi:Tol biopolymer transport system component
VKSLTCIAAWLIVLALASPASASTTGDVIFSDYRGNGIYAMNPDGTGVSHLFAGEANVPRWAPDGSGFCFVAGRYWGRIRWMDADGGNLHTLISPAELPPDWGIAYLAWSPDGSQLLVSLIQWRPWAGRYAYRLYVFPKNGSSYTLVASHAVTADWGSSDKIMAVSDADGTLLLMDADGSDREPVDGTVGSSVPRWSPDGSRIVYERDEEIWVVDVGGGNPEQLTHSAARDFAPTWSRTGARIMWSHSTNASSGFELWVMQADGGKQRRITFTPDIMEWSPDWKAAL